MLISQHRRRLILVVIIALFLGTAAEEASTQRVSTFVNSAVSEWIDEAFPLETPALDKIPAAVTAGAISGSSPGRQFPTSPTGSPSDGLEPRDVFGPVGSVLSGTQPLNQQATDFDGSAAGSAGSFAAGGGGQAGGNSRRSGTGGGAGGGASSGVRSGEVGAGSSAATGHGSSPSDARSEAIPSPSELAEGPASELAERGTSSSDSRGPEAAAQPSGRGEPDTLSTVAPPTLLPSGPGLTSADRNSFNPEFDWALPAELETSPALSSELPLGESATVSSTIATIPEPGTLVLFGTGLMALAIWSRARVRRVSRT